MKEFYLDIHATHCPCNNKEDKSNWAKFCELNPNRFLFFLGTKFILITYNACMNMGDEYDFKKTLIDKVITDNKVFEYYDVNRGVNVQDNLRDFRIRNKALRKHIEQINFIYWDNAGKKYAITTRTKYLDAICNQEEIDTNYNEAKEMLTKNEYDWLLEPLKNLYYANKVYNENEAEYHKTIDHLINSINQLTK